MIAKNNLTEVEDRRKPPVPERFEMVVNNTETRLIRRARIISLLTMSIAQSEYELHNDLVHFCHPGGTRICGKVAQCLLAQLGGNKGWMVS